MKPVPLFVRISPELRRALRHRAVEEDVPVQELVERLLRGALRLRPPEKASGAVHQREEVQRRRAR